MKFLKISFLTLIIAIIADMSIAFAYSTVSGTVFSLELDKNNAEWTDYRTKNTWSTMTYEHLNSFTWLTNPCPKCKVAAKPYTENGDIGVAVVTVTGDKKGFTNPTNFQTPDNYRLNIWRFDTTLLTTYHGSQWMINPK